MAHGGVEMGQGLHVKIIQVRGVNGGKGWGVWGWGGEVDGIGLMGCLRGCWRGEGGLTGPC